MAYIVQRGTLNVIRALFAEFWSTFIFLFAIECQAINNNRNLNTVQGLIVGGLTTAFAAIVVVACFGRLSGANFNPAVTFAAMLTLRLPILLGIGYILTQIAASCVVCCCLIMIFPGNNRQVLDQIVLRKGPGESYYRSFNAELVYTFIFITIVYMVAWNGATDSIYAMLRYPRRKQSDVSFISGAETSVAFTDLTEASNVSSTSSATNAVQVVAYTRTTKFGYVPVAIGFALGFLAMISSSTSGGAFNPARAIGPAIVAWRWTGQWVYWAGDLAGAACACIVCCLFFSGRFISPKKAYAI